MTEQAIYFDSSKCTACKGCQAACKCWNNLPTPYELNSAGTFTGTLQNPPDLQPNTRLIITFNEADNGKKYGVNWAFGRRACMHCTNPACVSVCPSGALYVDEETGLVTYDSSKCIGCQYCRSACPFDVPRHTNVGLTGDNIKINKCTGCVDRVKQGRKPACVSTCQPGALQFGDRDEMLKMAKERVEYLKGKYDYIILDTPPVGLVSDTLNMGHFANMTIFVVRADYSPKGNFQLINDIAKKNRLPKCNLVLNGMDLEKRKYGYYYGYGKYGNYGKYGKYGKYGNYGYGYGVYGNYGVSDKETTALNEM